MPTVSTDLMKQILQINYWIPKVDQNVFFSISICVLKNVTKLVMCCYHFPHKGTVQSICINMSR